MDWLTIAMLVGGAIVVWLAISIAMGNLGFWNLVRRNPDLAIEMFRQEDGCYVDRQPEQTERKRYTGPFRLMTSDGASHLIYMPADEVDAIQNRIGQLLKIMDGRKI